MPDTQEAFGSEPPGKGWTKTGEGKWTKRAPTVGVVGGGPGGLFTAYLLRQQFPKAKVTILEASDRVGGKIRTDQFSDGTPFESGVAELYEYLRVDDRDDPLRCLIEEDLGLHTTDMDGGCVCLGEEICRDLEEFGHCFGQEARQEVEAFYALCAELMPLEDYAHRWQPDNSHPWANKTFYDCLCEEVQSEDACRYICCACHSDIATCTWTCNGVNGIKNVLLDHEEYMQLYHVVGGIEQIVDRLCEKVKAEIRLGCRVMAIRKDASDRYEVLYRHQGQDEILDFDAVVLAVPNHWLGQIRCENPLLCEAMHRLRAHYDQPAHYLRVSMLFKDRWWSTLKIPGDYFMLDVGGGCCVYDESHRWKSRQGHVLSFLLAGEEALNLCSHNQTQEEIVDWLVESLPDFLRSPVAEHLVEAQVDCYAGSINAQPGGWPAEELEGEHQPEPKEHPGLFVCGDYLFDSTLNAAFMSANVTVDLLLEHFGVEAREGTEAVTAISGEKL
jgi:hypothetical protein